MSLPNFPAGPNISREDAINSIIMSIAMEEVGLSHIINAEGEKLQYVLGIPGASIEDVLETNESITNMLKQAAINQQTLADKLNTAVSSSVLPGPPGPKGDTGLIDMRLTSIDDYLALPDAIKLAPDILWVIYPNGYL